jgi:hypothetical protein
MLLDRVSADDLNTWLNEWRQRKGLRDSYKQLVEQRILELITLKERPQQGGGSCDSTGEVTEHF